MTSRFSLATLAFSLLNFAFLNAQKVELRPIANDFLAPVEMAFSTDSSRVFVVSQIGKIWAVELASGQKSPEPFLNLEGKVFHNWSETGLLGLAFDPEFSQNGHFYCFFSDLDTSTTLARFTATGPDFLHSTKAETSTRFDILKIPQKTVQHKGGCLRFGPDGFLWISTGDGSGGFDPDNDAQNPLQLNGKMLRIDVKNGLPYSIPSSNPFFGFASKRNEIWATGLRNPFKFSFDSETGDRWIGDLGQAQTDEIDFEKADETGGKNYGWRCKEGNLWQDSSAVCTSGGPFSAPIFEHQNATATMGWCRNSITGGFVFYSKAPSRLGSRYVFGDFCHSKIWSLKSEKTGKKVAELAFDGSTLLVPPNFTAFGESPTGRLFVLGWNSKTLYEVEDFCQNHPLDSPVLTWAAGLFSMKSSWPIVDVEWFLDGQKIYNSEWGVLFGTAPGWYVGRAFDQNGCWAETAAFELKANSVASNAVSEDPFSVKIWPNPTVGARRFYIETDAVSTKMQTVAVDALGHVVLKKTFEGRTEIDLGPTASGVFQLFLIDEKGRRTMKMLVVD